MVKRSHQSQFRKKKKMKREGLVNEGETEVFKVKQM
jgi:hypothetical protein